MPARPRTCTDDDVAAALHALDVEPRAIPAAAWPAGLQDLDHPGLYAWWVDDAGAEELAQGLNVHIPVGRVYAGQTGATRWPSGTPSRSTLRTRIGRNHLRGTIYG